MRGTTSRCIAGDHSSAFVAFRDGVCWELALQVRSKSHAFSRQRKETPLAQNRAPRRPLSDVAQWHFISSRSNVHQVKHAAIAVASQPDADISCMLASQSRHTLLLTDRQVIIIPPTSPEVEKFETWLQFVVGQTSFSLRQSLLCNCITQEAFQCELCVLVHWEHRNVRTVLRGIRLWWKTHLTSNMLISC